MSKETNKLYEQSIDVQLRLIETLSEIVERHAGPIINLMGRDGIDNQIGILTLSVSRLEYLLKRAPVGNKEVIARLYDQLSKVLVLVMDIANKYLKVTDYPEIAYTEDWNIFNRAYQTYMADRNERDRIVNRFETAEKVDTLFTYLAVEANGIQISQGKLSADAEVGILDENSPTLKLFEEGLVWQYNLNELEKFLLSEREAGYLRPSSVRFLKNIEKIKTMVADEEAEIAAKAIEKAGNGARYQCRIVILLNPEVIGEGPHGKPLVEFLGQEIEVGRKGRYKGFAWGTCEEFGHKISLLMDLDGFER